MQSKMNKALNKQLGVKEEKKKPEGKLDQILDSLNKNLETIAKAVGGGGNQNQIITKVTPDGEIYTSQQNY